jgi:hypothetical protein
LEEIKICRHLELCRNDHVKFSRVLDLVFMNHAYLSKLSSSPLGSTHGQKTSKLNTEANPFLSLLRGLCFDWQSPRAVWWGPRSTSRRCPRSYNRMKKLQGFTSCHSGLNPPVPPHSHHLCLPHLAGKQGRVKANRAESPYCFSWRRLKRQSMSLVVRKVCP